MEEITEAYYFFLKGLINDGITKKRVHRVTQINGRDKYFLII